MNKYADELDLLMKDTLEVTKDINIEIWLEAGTLLGCKRDNDYIPWEKDIDFGSWQHLLSIKKYKKFKKKMIKKKYIISKTGNVVTIRRLGFTCFVDIALYKKVQNTAIVPLKNISVTNLGKLFERLIILFKSKNISKTLEFHKTNFIKILYIIIYFIFVFFTPNVLKKKFIKITKKYLKKNSKDLSWKIPLKFLFKTKKIKFRNFVVSIPHKSLDYIKFRYGNNWKTPRPDWNQYTEDKSMALVQKNN